LANVMTQFIGAISPVDGWVCCVGSKLVMTGTGCLSIVILNSKSDVLHTPI